MSSCGHYFDSRKFQPISSPKYIVMETMPYNPLLRAPICIGMQKTGHRGAGGCVSLQTNVSKHRQSMTAKRNIESMDKTKTFCLFSYLYAEALSQSPAPEKFHVKKRERVIAIPRTYTPRLFATANSHPSL